MSSSNKIDMSLDEIIKLNRKKVKTEKKDLLQPKDNFQRAGRGRGGTIRGRGGTIRGRGTTIRGRGITIRGRGGTVKGRGGTVRGRGTTVRGRGTTVRGRGSTIRGRVGTIRGRVGTVRGRVGTVRGHVGTVRGRGSSIASDAKARKQTTYKVPNKLRKYATQNAKFTGAKGNAQQRRKLSQAHHRRNAVNRARQTIFNNVRNQQRLLRSNLVNKHRGIAADTSMGNKAAVSTNHARRKLTRPGFGVMHADLVEIENKQKKQALVAKYASEAAISTLQSNQPIKRTWQRKNKDKVRVPPNPAIKTEPGPILTVSVHNEQASAAFTSRAQTPRTHTVANRILRNTLQQPIRQRRLLQRRSRGVGGGRSSQVRILNNTIHKLRQQVSSLQQVQNNRQGQLRNQNFTRGRSQSNKTFRANQGGSRTVRW